MTYRHEAYICKAVESFRNQKFRDVEFIIVDDCSPDNTYDIAKMAAEGDERFRIYRNPKNLGAHENSRYSLSLARGRFIGFCEGDDFLIDRDRISQQCEVLSDKTVSLVFTASIDVDESGERLSINAYGSKRRYFTLGEAVKIGGNLCATASTLYRRSVINSLPPEFYFFPVGDYPLQVIAASQGRVAYLPIMGAAYRKFSVASWSREMTQSSKYLANHLATIKMLNFLYIFCGRRDWLSFEFAKAKYCYFLSVNQDIPSLARLSYLARSGLIALPFFATFIFSPGARAFNSIRRWLVTKKMSRSF
jgi:glycosyltransferase involved in cell wall biosynthesis